MGQDTSSVIDVHLHFASRRHFHVDVKKVWVALAQTMLPVVS